MLLEAKLQKTFFVIQRACKGRLTHNAIALWTDRNKSSLALVRLTEHRDPAILAELRQHALPSLKEMARWKVSGHAYAPFFLLGRVAGFAEKEINEAWEHGDHAAFVDAAAKRAPVTRSGRIKVK